MIELRETREAAMVDVGGMSLEDLAEVHPSVVVRVLRGVLEPACRDLEAVSGFANDGERPETDLPPEKPGTPGREGGGPSTADRG
ncbi:hypothetical protein ACFVWN_13850 [Nocardiopsis flavescens]|uniref:FXSXX-COOH protein n=1 Tax=Nocardiopsis flavescens TaxID=758803 RepID=A0A1M6SYB9_9ACTN|nr:hypothetical protein [Nocardiopsis flavescens]SHK49742.1 FXSXX-COOH protein [Nocardiopsis flavescens]